MQSWENFWDELYSNYWQGNKAFWKTFGVFATKYIILLDPSKTKSVCYSAMWRTSLIDGESTSNVYWTQSTSYHWKRGILHLGEENTITAAKIVLAVKMLNPGIVSGCDEIRTEILAAFNRGDIWLTRVYQAPWCFGKSPKELGRSSPYISCHPKCWKMMPQSNWTKAGGYPVRYSSWSYHYRTNFLQRIFEVS